MPFESFLTTRTHHPEIRDMYRRNDDIQQECRLLFVHSCLPDALHTECAAAKASKRLHMDTNCHGATAFSDGRLLNIAEDVGQHASAGQ
jgi:hypothetical protein